RGAGGERRARAAARGEARPRLRGRARRADRGSVRLLAAGGAWRPGTRALRSLAMGLFRPTRTVVGPSGTYWELYVSKTATPSWQPGIASERDYFDDPLDVVMLPVMLLSAIW